MQHQRSSEVAWRSLITKPYFTGRLLIAVGIQTAMIVGALYLVSALNHPFSGAYRAQRVRDPAGPVQRVPLRPVGCQLPPEATARRVSRMARSAAARPACHPAALPTL